MKTTQNTDLVRTYLKEIGRVPLLTHEEEIVLGKQVQQMTALEKVRTALAEDLDREPIGAMKSHGISSVPWWMS
jgi:RNA polymerase nonessential primary-like sigma factor